MNARKRQQETTRRAILEALAEVIVESGATDFSVQAVADRAGVTHRTVYNYFPTRQALNDGLAVFVEEEIAQKIGGEPPDAKLSLDALRSMPDTAFPMFETVEAHARAYVMLMVASRAPATIHRKRSARIAKLVERDAGPMPHGAAKMVTAALRMHMSTWTWHLMTEHLGLSLDECRRSSSWAMNVLIDAVQHGNLPDRSES